MARSKHDLERQRLADEVATCRRAHGAASRAATEAQQQVERLEVKRRAVLADQARGKSSAVQRLAEIEQQLADAKQEHARQQELAGIAIDTGRNAERQLKAHLAQHLDHFLKGADRLADKAEAERQQVLAAIERAAASEEAARQEWVELRRACQSNGEDLGQMPPPTFDDKLKATIVKAPRPEPRHVARSRKRSIGVPRLPAAIRALFPKQDGSGEWTPLAQEGDPLDY